MKRRSISLTSAFNQTLSWLDPVYPGRRLGHLEWIRAGTGVRRIGKLAENSGGRIYPLVHCGGIRRRAGTITLPLASAASQRIRTAAKLGRRRRQAVGVPAAGTGSISEIGKTSGQPDLPG